MKRTPDKLEIRGHRVFSQPARMSLRGLSAMADAGLAGVLVSVYAASSHLAELHPLPLSRWFGIFLLAWIVPWIVLRVALGHSLGEAFWGLRARPGARFPFAFNALLEAKNSASRGRLIASALTVASLGAGVLAIHHVAERHPLALIATEQSLLPSLPIIQGDSGLSAESWRVLPFFYNLGSWPISYNGVPVLFTLPYEKGPPALFVGKIQAKWGESSRVRLTLEGPKTPRGIASREELHRCLAHAPNLSCVSSRLSALSRHIEAMQTLRPDHWEMSWFRVENAALGMESETQGIFIRAESETSGQDRYILINSAGAHQAIYLDYPRGAVPDEGLRARAVLEAAIRSLRSSAQVSEGRAWIDKELEAVRLNPKTRGEEDPRKLVELQALLVAKLSLDPGIFEAYFHLAGTSILLLRRATAKPADAQNPWLHLSTPTEKSLINALRLFARDLSEAGLATGEEKQARLRELDAFLLESAKY